MESTLRVGRLNHFPMAGLTSLRSGDAFFSGRNKEHGFLEYAGNFWRWMLFLLDTVTSYFGNNIRKLIRKFIATKY